MRVLVVEVCTGRSQKVNKIVSRKRLPWCLCFAGYRRNALLWSFRLNKKITRGLGGRRRDYDCYTLLVGYKQRYLLNASGAVTDP